VTISNTERSHKLYSLIHNAERNRLLNHRVDKRVKGAAFLHFEREPEREEYRAGDFSFLDPGNDEESVFEKWYEAQRALDLLVARSTNESAPDDSAADRIDESEVASLQHDDESEVASLQHETETEQQASHTTRSGRPVVLTEKLRKCGITLHSGVA
jgi:hypothetical protein